MAVVKPLDSILRSLHPYFLLFIDFCGDYYEELEAPGLRAIDWVENSFETTLNVPGDKECVPESNAQGKVITVIYK